MSTYEIIEPGLKPNTVELYETADSKEPDKTMPLEKFCFSHPQLAAELFEDFEFLFEEEEAAILEETGFTGVTLELPITRREVDASRDPNDTRTIYKAFVDNKGQLCYMGKPFGKQKISKRYAQRIQDKINYNLSR